MTFGFNSTIRPFSLVIRGVNLFVSSSNEIPVIFNQTLTKNKAPYAIDYAISQLITDIPDIQYGGYKIYLTVDQDAQEIARESLKASYDDAIKRDISSRGSNSKDDSYVKELNGAMITMESGTGRILAMVGGVDYNQSVFNRAYQSKRQAGSAIKPFLYQIALNEGYNPASQLFDISRTYNYTVGGVQKKWQPKNYGGKFEGIVSLRDSLTFSRNLSSIFSLSTSRGVVSCPFSGMTFSCPNCSNRFICFAVIYIIERRNSLSLLKTSSNFLESPLRIASIFAFRLSVIARTAPGTDFNVSYTSSTLNASLHERLRA